MEQLAAGVKTIAQLGWSSGVRFAAVVCCRNRLSHSVSPYFQIQSLLGICVNQRDLGTREKGSTMLYAVLV